MKLYISKSLENMGGGGNTFARNFARWLRGRPIKLVRRLEEADRAIILAHQSDPNELGKARNAGTRIVHRLDEDFDQNDSPHRVLKHAKILELNKLADVTVFQSVFCKENIYPHLQPKNYQVIYNGADRHLFKAGKRPGTAIGHVTWSAGAKKRLDLLYEFISKNPQERFLLVGRHASSPYPFARLPNVELLGSQPHFRLPAIYRKMKMLLMPSERDPCPNVVVEAISCGVPVCYNPSGGVPELVKDCGVELGRFDVIVGNLNVYRHRCLKRHDLDFNRAARLYLQA